MIQIYILSGILIAVILYNLVSDKRKEKKHHTEINSSKCQQEEGENSPEHRVLAQDVKLLEYGRKAGLRIARELSDDKDIQNAIASEVSVLFYTLQDAYQAAMGASNERRESNLRILVAVYWKSFNAAFGMSVDEAGTYFDDRQRVFAGIFRKYLEVNEGFLKDSEDYLVELLSWMVEMKEPSKFKPGSNLRDAAPVSMGLLLRHQVYSALEEILSSSVPDFLMIVANNGWLDIPSGAQNGAQKG